MTAPQPTTLAGFKVTSAELQAMKAAAVAKETTVSGLIRAALAREGVAVAPTLPRPVAGERKLSR